MNRSTKKDSRVGQEAPSLAVTDSSGRRVKLDEFRGKWLLLVFHRHLA